MTSFFTEESVKTWKTWNFEVMNGVKLTYTIYPRSFNIEVKCLKYFVNKYLLFQQLLFHAYVTEIFVFFVF